MTPFVWMFIKTYEYLREFIINNKSITTLIQMEYSAFEEATVPICSFVLKNGKSEQDGIHIKLSDFKGGMDLQRQKVLEALTDKNCGYFYETNTENFSKIPGMPIAYWIGKGISSAFNNKSLDKLSITRMGLTTGNNDYYLRLWHEVEIESIGFYMTREQAKESKLKWFPYNKGGDYRKWYGNRDYIVNWYDDGQEMQTKLHPSGNRIWAHNFNLDFNFKKHITWNDITSGDISFRAFEDGFLFDSSAAVAFVNEEYFYYLMGYLNTKFVNNVSKLLNPTLHFKLGDFDKLPLKIEYQDKVSELSKRNIILSKQDWDSFETSWDFQRHPLLNGINLPESYINWGNECRNRFKEIKKNEEELNQFFIDIFNLKAELTPDIEDKNVTVRISDLQQNIRSFISYSVGCMFGRYSLDVDGLAYAGGSWDDSKYSTFIPDKDNILPITDEQYFEDDVVGLFCAFLKKTFVAETLEENLDFIAKALGNRGNSSRDVIRNYFLKDFFKDHCKIYQKRPIYWLFDSGKADGFKALIYLHRYNEDTIGNLRIDYLHRMQRIYESEIARMQETIENSPNAREVTAATKRKEKLVKQLKETKEYDEKIAHLALARIAIDLDDGVKVNYEKVQTGTDGKKLEVLAKI